MWVKNRIKNFHKLKFKILTDLFALLFVLAAAKAQEDIIEDVNEAEAAQFMPMPMNVNPMMYSRSHFPIDYSKILVKTFDFFNL